MEKINNVAYKESIEIIEKGLPVKFMMHNSDTDEHSVVDLHFHNMVEIIYATEGENHIAWISGKPHTFSAGDLILINSECVHGFIYAKGKHICLRFDPEIIYNSHNNPIGLKYILPFILNSAKHTIKFTKEQLEETGISQLMYDVYSEYKNKAYGYEYAVQIMINEIYLKFLRFWDNQKINMDFENEIVIGAAKWLGKVFAYISDNYSHPITALEMANLCNMSYSYFSRSFKKIMHKSFSEYLNYVRITEAEKLLLTTDMNITEIAMTVGFSTSSYFIQQFKNYKKISPKQYKMLNES